MIEKIVGLLSKIVDFVLERRSGRQVRTIEEQQEEIKNLNERIRYEQSKSNAQLNAQRAATEAGRHINEEYRGKK